VQPVTSPAALLVANSDALSRYMLAIGLDISPDRLNDLLVLLAVLMSQTGGGLGLALGMALQRPDTPNGRSLDTILEPPARGVSGRSRLSVRLRRPGCVLASGAITTGIRATRHDDIAATELGRETPAGCKAKHAASKPPAPARWGSL
jgi:hypothetical protein